MRQRTGDQVDLFGGLCGSLFAGKDSVLLLLVLIMGHAMKTELAALSKRLGTPSKAAHKRLGLGMDMHMLRQILLKRKALRAEFAGEGFNAHMGVEVSPQCELGAVLFVATSVFANIF